MDEVIDKLKDPIRVGTESKGGVNPPPTTPKPDFIPKGQVGGEKNRCICKI